jgi:hypothetical protein
MTAKTQAKNAVRKQAAHTPKADKPTASVKLDRTVHALIVTSYKACLAAGKAGVSEYAAFAALIKALPLNDAKALLLVCIDLKETYGADHADAAQIRINIVNNARRVEHGGTKDKVTCKGRGRTAMLEALDSVTSIRELKKAMAEAKPEGLKDARGGKRTIDAAKTGAGGKAEAKSVKTASVPKTRSEALAAAIQVLEFVEKHFLLPGNDAETIGAVDSAVKALAAALKVA